MTKSVRIKNSVAALKASSYASLFRRINPSATFTKLQSFLAQKRNAFAEPAYLTLPTAAAILGIDRHTAARAITDPNLIPYQKSSNGLRLIEPDVLRAFILDLQKAFPNRR